MRHCRQHQPVQARRICRRHAIQYKIWPFQRRNRSQCLYSAVLFLPHAVASRRTLRAGCIARGKVGKRGGLRQCVHSATQPQPHPHRLLRPGTLWALRLALCHQLPHRCSQRPGFTGPRTFDWGGHNQCVNAVPYVTHKQQLHAPCRRSSWTQDCRRPNTQSSVLLCSPGLLHSNKSLLRVSEPKRLSPRRAAPTWRAAGRGVDVRRRPQDPPSGCSGWMWGCGGRAARTSVGPGDQGPMIATGGLRFSCSCSVAQHARVWATATRAGHARRQLNRQTCRTRRP